MTEVISDEDLAPGIPLDDLAALRERFEEEQGTTPPARPVPPSPAIPPGPPPAPAIPAVPPPPKHPQPILPGAAIKDRLAAFTEGDKAVQDLAAIPDLTEPVFRELARAQAAASQTVNTPMAQQLERLETLKKLRAEQQQKLDKAAKAMRDQAVARLRTQTPAKIVASLPRKQSKEFKDRAKEALGFVKAITAQTEREATDQHLSEVAVQATRKRRSFAEHVAPSKATVNLSKGAPVRTAVHELGHALEFTLPGALAAAQAFLEYRTQGETPQRLRTLFPGRFAGTEYGRKDQFDQFFQTDKAEAWYCGKDYGPRATEIVSMGLEALYSDPVNFAAKDPEYCKFILGILSGALR
jgi:hypothetical protein